MEKLAELEALLFAHGAPIEIRKISEMLKMSAEKTTALTEELSGRLAEDESRGTCLVINGQTVQLLTKPVFANIAEELAKSECREELTPAALEALAIVAYLGPISRAEIDYIRGVNSTFTVRNLMLRGLVERIAGKRRGTAYEYRATIEFMRHMGLQKSSDLPEHERYSTVILEIRERERKAFQTETATEAE